MHEFEQSWDDWGDCIKPILRNKNGLWNSTTTGVDWDVI